MQKPLPLFKDRYNVRITAIDFIGVSLGALEGAYLSVIDDEEQKIGIEKYLLVNPPLDLSNALKKIDDWLVLKDKFGGDEAPSLVGKAIAITESFSEERRADPEVVDNDVGAFLRNQANGRA